MEREYVNLEVHRKTDAPDVTYKKLIMTSIDSFKVAYVDNVKNKRFVKDFNLLTLGDNRTYNNIFTRPMLTFHDRMRYREDPETHLGIPYLELRITLFTSNNLGASIGVGANTFSEFPIYSVAPDETETDEPATATITLPFDEQPIWLFQDLMFRRLYRITRKFLDGLNAERVALLTKVDQLAGGVGDDEDHRRYDHAANLGRGLIGYTWEQINILSDTSIPDGKKKTRAEIETLIEKLEATFPDQHAIDKFFVRHDEVNWQDVRQNRQIRLVGDNYRPGEILKNINEEHLKTKNGVTAVDQVSAENEYARCVKQCFRSAWADRRDRPRHTIQYSFGAGDSAATVPKSQLTDESLLE